MSKKMEKVYKEVAKKNGASVEEVKREMQAAINSAYENPNIYARRVPSKGKIPTIDEFIEYFAKMEM